MVDDFSIGIGIGGRWSYGTCILPNTGIYGNIKFFVHLLSEPSLHSPSFVKLTISMTKLWVENCLQALETS